MGDCGVLRAVREWLVMGGFVAEGYFSTKSNFLDVKCSGGWVHILLLEDRLLLTGYTSGLPSGFGGWGVCLSDPECLPKLAAKIGEL
jgi:hypothetical protein